jgi:hypothetical protein
MTKETGCEWTWNLGSIVMWNSFSGGEVFIFSKSLSIEQPMEGQGQNIFFNSKKSGAMLFE